MPNGRNFHESLQYPYESDRMRQSVRSLLLPSPLQILSQSNLHQFPLLSRLAVQFNLLLCEFLEFDVRAAIAFASF
jgi:hypothetical protein